MMAKTTKDTRYRSRIKPKTKDGLKILMTDQEKGSLAIRAGILGAEMIGVLPARRLVQRWIRHDQRERFVMKEGIDSAR